MENNTEIVFEENEVVEPEEETTNTEMGCGVAMLIGSGITVAAIAAGGLLKKAWQRRKAKKMAAAQQACCDDDEAVADAEVVESEED